ncbi:MAG: 2-hydroxyglutaryl-CoA dehydratase D-component [Brevundimonas sp.]|nr:2-hydroxyglutaryl-CoA dehydratase D-component [Brevundimonas sp.]
MTTLASLLENAMGASETPDQSVVACLGADVPYEMIAAAGLTPWRLTAPPVPVAEGLPGLSDRSRAFVQRLTDPAFLPAGVAIAHDRAEDAQLFAVLRELTRTGRGPAQPYAFIDLLHQQGEPTRAYNLARLQQFKTWLEDLIGRPITGQDLADAVRATNSRRARLAEILKARAAGTLFGAEALELIHAVSRLSSAQADTLLGAADHALATAPTLAGKRVVLTGSAHEDAGLYRAIEAAGAIIVSEDHVRGAPWTEALLDETLDPLEAICARSQSPLTLSPGQTSAERARALVDRAQALGTDAVIHFTLPGDEASPWDIKETRAALAVAAIPFLALDFRKAPDAEATTALTQRIAAVLATGEDAPVAKTVAASATSSAKPSAPKPADREARRSRKSLACASDFGAWQRDWFAEVRQRAQTGPFAVVSADAPQEILRALDIPYVVNQWWASIVAAKQKARAYGQLLRDNDYPSHVETYSAQGLAAALDTDVEDAPWGGLPKPSILSVVANSDPGTKLYGAWANETGADLFVYERSIDGRIDLPIDWWDDLPERWDETLEAERLDLMAAQIEAQIARLEALTGRTLDRARLVEVMNLVNEQEDYYRRTRDLIANAYPCPVSVVDTMPATMVPQWHRGTVWARDAAKRMFEEVSERAAAGEAACPNERLRLMWVGRGLWSNTPFYQRWEESHGAVFVWSMYLGLAADGYLRSFEGEHDVVRALAARFVTMGDELRMPTWSGAWHVKEAQTHGCHGVVAIDDADPLVLDALERAGIPVCRVAMNNMGAGDAAVDAEITAFIDRLSAALPSV